MQSELVFSAGNRKFNHMFEMAMPTFVGFVNEFRPWASELGFQKALPRCTLRKPCTNTGRTLLIRWRTLVRSFSRRPCDRKKVASAFHVFAPHLWFMGAEECEEWSPGLGTFAKGQEA